MKIEWGPWLGGTLDRITQGCGKSGVPHLPPPVRNLPNFLFNMICLSGNSGVHDWKMMAQEQFLRRVLKLCWGNSHGTLLYVDHVVEQTGLRKVYRARNLRPCALSMCIKNGTSSSIIVRAELREPFLQSLGLGCTITAILYVDKHLGSTVGLQESETNSPEPRGFLYCRSAQNTHLSFRLSLGFRALILQLFRLVIS